jgi:ATP-dependent helicase/DNAse subunit B
MPLTLVTGPANAAKAGAVLERFRAALAREPLLVVPTFADVGHYQRELAAAGVVFGAEVLTFSRLVRVIAAVAGVPGRPLGSVARERVVRAAIRDARLQRLAPSAAAPGFAAAAAALLAELQRSLITPQRFTRALRQWGGVAYADELAALYAAYRRRVEGLGRPDADGHAWAALNALRSDPASWGSRPVFLYGFDDLTPVQLDAVETLVSHAGAEVCVALPYEPGRYALAGSAATVALLTPLAAEVVALPERAAHYAPTSRTALHHLERGLFEPHAARRSPNGAVRLLEAGGERAEAELVGAEVLELMRDGVEPEDVAVLVRGEGHAALFAQVLEAYGIPVAHLRRVRFSATRLGAGVLAYARAALPGGSAADVLAWLRTPGKLETPAVADALEALVRRREVAGARDAARLWERAGAGAAADCVPIEQLDALAAAAADGPPALLDVLVREADSIWAAPHRRRADVLGPRNRDDARAAAELRAAAAELRSLATADAELAGDATELLEALGAVLVREGGATGGVLLADPLAIRARRFRAVFVCGLQDGEFPRRPVPEPFLDDDARRALASASGLRLTLHEDDLDRERSLFYACVSRPEEVLFLSWRSSDEEGDPLQASPFIDDVRALFDDALWEGRGRRLLAEVTWTPRDAPTPLELRRAQAAGRALPDPPPLAAPHGDPVLQALAARRREPARGLETFAGCGVRWLVEHLLRPARIEPDSEPQRRGLLAHDVLRQTLGALSEHTGSARLSPESLPRALSELEAVLAQLRPRAPGARADVALRVLEADLRRYLVHEAEHGAGLEPEWLEWSFGGEHDDHGALAVAGSELEVSGRVDRIDVGPGGAAIVRDYKGSKAPAGRSWAAGQHLQVALYALAARELLGLQPVGGLYQPLWGRELRPRGFVRDDVDGRYVATDAVSAEELERALLEAGETAVATARELRAGRVRACPDSCRPQGGCAHPTICRAVEGASPLQAG